MKWTIYCLPGLFAVVLNAQNPVMHWNFEKVENRVVTECISGQPDTLEGYFDIAPAFTIETWLALGSYPLNWCPIMTTESSEIEGIRFLVGPLGQVSLQAAIDEQWVSVSTAKNIVPLREWMHIAAVYSPEGELILYINGKVRASLRVQGPIDHSNRNELRVGMVAYPEKPSDIHRTWGTLPDYFGIDGIIDELKVYDQPLAAKQIAAAFRSIRPGMPDIAPRRLPAVQMHPGTFGAFYTRLKYYPGWDNLWPVEEDPDIVVCFKQSPVKLIFWRGIRYGAAWVSENENWMTDQSVEAWEHGDRDREGCFEHMQDRHCRFSHVRIIENTDARVVVHWRYAPVSAYKNTWRPDPKTDWECWIDEYYYIYPDASGIRRVSWKKGTLGNPHQLQETLALLHPGQIVSDLLEKELAFVADYENNRSKVLFVEDPNSPPYGPFSWNDKHTYTIQRYNFKSQNKPFICFEPGNTMYIRHSGLGSYERARGCNHFPVGQARCDGRTTRMSDRPSHATSFPISDPVVHEERDRLYWNGLYGMNSMDMDQLIRFGRSWAYAPELRINGNNAVSEGYDRSRRCYQITKQDDGPVSFTVAAGNKTPLINPAFYVKNWTHSGAKIEVNGKAFDTCEIGIQRELGSTDLIVFIWIEAEQTMDFCIIPDA